MSIDQLPTRVLSRRSCLRLAALGAAGSVLAACQQAAPAAPTVPQPTEAPKPAAPAATTAAVASAATTAPATAAQPTTAPAAPTTAPAAKTSEPTTKIVAGLNDNPTKTTNPGNLTNPSGAWWHWLAFDGLTSYTRDGKTIPGLATEWKTSDATIWDFTLGDWSFQNGTALKPSDVVASYNYYLDANNKMLITGLLGNVAKVEESGAKGVRFTLKAPDPSFTKLQSLVMIMPMDLVGKNKDAFFMAPVGTGPFRYVSTDFAKGLVFQAMGSTFKTPRGVPNIKDLELQFIGDNAVKELAVRSGDIDVAFTISSQGAVSLQDAGYPVVVDSTPGSANFLMDMWTDGQPFMDARVRQAMNYAVDKEAIIKGPLGGYSEVDSQIIFPGVLGYNPEINVYPYDEAKARQLLMDAGYGNGFETTLTGNNVFIISKDVVEAVSGYLSKVGVKANIVLMESAPWNTDFYSGPERRPGMFGQIFSWDPRYEAPEAWRIYSSDYTKEGGRRWDNAEFDRLYQAGKQTVDDAQRAQMYQQAGKILHDEAAALFMHRNNRVGATGKNVKWEAGFYPDMWVNKISKG